MSSTRFGAQNLRTLGFGVGTAKGLIGGEAGEGQ